MRVNIVKEKRRREEIRRFYENLPMWSEEMSLAVHRMCRANMGAYDYQPKDIRDKRKVTGL